MNIDISRRDALLGSGALIVSFSLAGSVEQASAQVSAKPVVLTEVDSFLAIDKNGKVIPPSAYDPRSNGKTEAVSTRPAVVVREPDCVGCRLCYNVCPVESCIQMVELGNATPGITWDQLSKQQPGVTEDWSEMEQYRQRMGIRIH